MSIRRARQLLADWLEPLPPAASQVWDRRELMLEEAEAWLRRTEATELFEMPDINLPTDHHRSVEPPR